MTKGYDVGYNLTEEIRQLLDADYVFQKTSDITLFEKAKEHILVLLGKELDEVEEYTKRRTDNVESCLLAIEEAMKKERSIQTVLEISGHINTCAGNDNSITSDYIKDVTRELLKYANGKQ